MPGYKRKGTSQRGVSKKRRTARVPRTVDPAMYIHKYKKEAFTESWNFGTTVASDYVRPYNPTFGDIPGSTQFTAIYDQYRIDKIKVTFYPNNEGNITGNNNAGTTNNNNQFYMTMGRQYGINLPSTGLYSRANLNSNMEELQDLVTVMLDQPRSFTFKPRIITNDEKELKYCPWISITNTTLPMIGMTAFMHDFNFENKNGQKFGVDVKFTIWYSCKGTR